MAKLKPLTYSSAAMKNYSPYHPTKLERIFHGAVAREAGNSDKNFNLARKIRFRLLSNLSR